MSFSADLNQKPYALKRLEKPNPIRGFGRSSGCFGQVLLGPSGGGMVPAVSQDFVGSFPTVVLCPARAI